MSLCDCDRVLCDVIIGIVYSGQYYTPVIGLSVILSCSSQITMVFCYDMIVVLCLLIC